MTKKLVVLCGISGSGKSTYAHKQFTENPLTTVVVNRDKIRELLFGYTEESIKDYYLRPDLGKLEKQVTLFEDTLIHDGLNLGKTVIVDATHLTVAYLKRYEFFNVPIEYVYFDVFVTEALDRDSKRTRQVGKDVITVQYHRFRSLERLSNFTPITFEQCKSLPTAILYDIDGTIAKMHNRSAYDWKRVGEDKTIDEVVATIDYIAELDRENRPKVIICTGRDGICLEETEDWLMDNGIHYDEIFIREEGDQRPDYIVKEEMWREIAKNYYIKAMYDDRNQVVRRARALGLKVFQVEYGNF